MSHIEKSRNRHRMTLNFNLHSILSRFSDIHSQNKMAWVWKLVKFNFFRFFVFDQVTHWESTDVSMRLSDAQILAHFTVESPWETISPSLTKSPPPFEKNPLNFVYLSKFRLWITLNFTPEITRNNLSWSVCFKLRVSIL